MIKVIKTAFLALLLLVSVASEGTRWSRTGDLIRGRSGYQGAVLTDGRVMVIGRTTTDCYELFSPATGTWINHTTFAPSDDHTMVILLPNGKALYVADNSFWLFDSRTNAWTTSGASAPWWSTYSCATLLRNGQVLMAYNSRDCKLYDCVTDALISTGASNSYHSSGIEVLLPSGKVIMIGGSSTTCDLYDPGTGIWSTAGSISSRRSKFVGVLLPPPWNEVLIAGASSQCELYDISAGTWTSTGSLCTSPRNVASMVLLPSGKALIVGGESNQSSEVYDPASQQWTDLETMISAHSHFSAAVLPTGKVLAVDGTSNSTCEIYDPSEGEWTQSLSLNTKRQAHTVTPLPIIHTTNCSTSVLIAGGQNLGGALESCELYNYQTERVSRTGDLNVARTHHTAVLTGSGKALVAGGRNSSSQACRSCELYDASTETWTLTGDLNESRSDHTATLLQNGEDVLVTGGTDSSGDYVASCEIYTGGVWNNTGTMSIPRSSHMAVILFDGRVLVIGGVNSGRILDSCEIWEPGSGNWTATGRLSNARCLHTALLLQSGKVLVIGGKNSGGPLSSCEIYDPATGNWSEEAVLSTARFLHNSALLYSGLVLAAGGSGTTGSLSSCEMYDPATHEWQAAGSLSTARSYHASVLIPAEKPYVVAIGGENNGQLLNTIEKYDVGLGYRLEWQSEITNHQAITLLSDSIHIEGKLFRGVSEADGGNHCHIVSSDHPIISALRIGGGNFQGNGGGDVLYIPPSSSWSETHTDVHLPSDAHKGYYRLWSIVNGIPCAWYKECIGVEDSKQSTVHSPQFSVFPNPFTHNTVMQFGVRGSQPEADEPLAQEFVDVETRHVMSLQIHDLAGRLVRSFPFNHLTIQPFNQIEWDGKNNSGKDVPAGIYFCKLTTNDYTAMRKLILMK